MSETNERLQVDTENFCALVKETLDRGQSFRFCANGSSMLPAVHDGDTVTVVSVGERSPKLGDIVLHRAGAGGMVAHRIIRITHRGLGVMFFTRGDAFGANSELVEEEDLLGRVTQVERHGRTMRVDQSHRRWRGLLWALRQTLRQHCRAARR